MLASAISFAKSENVSEEMFSTQLFRMASRSSSSLLLHNFVCFYRVATVSEKQWKTIFFQGQRKVSEICMSSGNWEICQCKGKVREIILLKLPQKDFLLISLLISQNIRAFFIWLRQKKNNLTIFINF